MKKKTYISTFVALLLVLASLFTVCPASAASPSYDLSRPASSHGRELDTADILEAYLGSPLSPAERDYLAAFGNLRLKYDAGITTSCVVTSYEGDLLSFSVLEYSYQTADGLAVSWIPRSVTLGEEAKPLLRDGGHYCADFSGVTEEDGLLAYIDYTLDVSISRADLSAALNMAYLDAPRLEADLAAREAEYLVLTEKYESDLITYGEYLAHIAVAIGGVLVALLHYRNLLNS